MRRGASCGSLDPADDAAGRDGFEIRRGFGQDDVFRADLGAEFAFERGVFVIFGDDEEVGFDAEEVVFEVEAFLVAPGDDDFIDHAQALEQGAFVVVGDGGFAALVVPEHLGGGEGDDEEIPERAGLLEELEVAGVEDVVTT